MTKTEAYIHTHTTHYADIQYTVSRTYSTRRATKATVINEAHYARTTNPPNTTHVNKHTKDRQTACVREREREGGSKTTQKLYIRNANEASTVCDVLWVVKRHTHGFSPCTMPARASAFDPQPQYE